MKDKISKILIFLFLLPFSLNVCLAQANQIVAKVNDEIITTDDLKRYSQMLLSKNNKELPGLNQKDFKKEALNRLVEDRLILQQAKREDIEVPQFWLEDKIKQLESGYSNRELFYDSLEDQGFSLSYLKKRLREKYLMKEVINRNVRAKVSILPGQIEQFYKENKQDFQAPPLAVFLIAKEKDRQQLEDIAEVIKKDGIEKAKKEYENELSEIKSYLNQLQEPLAQALENLADNKYSIKKIDDLYYLIYRSKIEPAHALELSKVQDKVYRYLWQRSFSKKFNQWVDSLKEDATVKIYLPSTP
ncbi:MAG: SurA N-terminal domain-containing protein [Candidatus Omnitrophica bacterium]|nr:SurA N-terminal domain-containing protein [Candidatus Omnitrophota bacterium]MCF7878368.1 SurA N-terminal domain-containing protein [Candidatus Omnitrophota bacterium]MCF7892826.1 SurA N-terminal domain-containing protein [Candidatus Omnitrophota bacterium]